MTLKDDEGPIDMQLAWWEKTNKKMPVLMKSNKKSLGAKSPESVA